MGFAFPTKRGKGEGRKHGRKIGANNNNGTLIWNYNARSFFLLVATQRGRKVTVGGENSVGGKAEQKDSLECAFFLGWVWFDFRRGPSVEEEEDGAKSDCSS